MPDIPRIGVWLTRSDPYWVQINEAVYQRGQQLSVELVPLEAALEFPGQPIYDRGRLAEDILSFGLSSLIATYVPKDPALQILSTGLSVVHLAETDFDHPNLIAFTGYYESAFLAGQYVAERLNGKGNVLVIGGFWEKEGEGGKSRVKAITDVLKNYPQLDWQHVPAPWVYDQAYSVIEKALKTLPGPINAIIGISDPLALAALNAGAIIGLTAPKTIFVGINGDPLALAAIANGSMAATVETDSASFGREAMNVAYALALGKPVKRNLSINSSLITVNNVGEYALKKLISIADIPSRLVGINREAEQFRIKQLEMVININQQIGGLLDKQKLLKEIAELINKNYHYNQVIVYYINQATQNLFIEFPQPSQREENPGRIKPAGLIEDVIRKGESVFIPDTSYSFNYQPDPDYPRTRSRAVIPIRYNRKVVGVLDLHSSRRIHHMRHELLGLQLLADQVGIVVQNTSLYDQANTARSIAEKADQLKTRLLANVSHELRAPINIILGYCQIALKETQDLSNELQNDLHQIYQSGEHLLRLINDLLDMSRLEIGALDLFPEMIEARSFVENVFRGMEDNLRINGVEWKLDLPENLPIIQADPVRLRQILLNLLSNSSKFTPRGQIILGAEVEPPHLHIWIHDTGTGIPPDVQELIFEPFGRIENLQHRPDGIGLGLSITRHLVALHNGSMTLESKMGEGSTFHIYLPLPSLIGTSPTVLSDSTEDVLLLISHQSEPGETILQLCQRRGLRIKQIRSIVDIKQIQNPGVIAWDMADAHPNDWALICQLRRFPHLCHLPFVLYNQKVHSLGLTNVLIKPVTHSTLLDMVESLYSITECRPILVVDDDPQACEMYERIIAEALPGSLVQSAADGQIALEMLKSFTPALVILDLVMPHVDGFTVLEHIRSVERLQSVPVLVLSGKLLTEQDAQRLDFAHVYFQSKRILDENEAIHAFQAIMSGDWQLPQPTSKLVKKTLVYLHQNYAMQLNRQQIASAVGVSEGYLSEIFKQEMGISPWETLNRLRIQRSCELLTNTDKSITDISTQVGFDDPSYFGRVFKKINGISPKTYREL